MSISVPFHANPIFHAFHFVLEKGKYVEDFVFQLWKGDCGVSESLRGRVSKIPASALAGGLVLVIGVALSVFFLVRYLRRSNDDLDSFGGRQEALKLDQKEEVVSWIDRKVDVVSLIHQTKDSFFDVAERMWKRCLEIKAFHDLNKEDCF